MTGGGDSFAEHFSTAAAAAATKYGDGVSNNIIIVGRRLLLLLILKSRERRYNVAPQPLISSFDIQRRSRIFLWAGCVVNVCAAIFLELALHTHTHTRARGVLHKQLANIY